MTHPDQPEKKECPKCGAMLGDNHSAFGCPKSTPPDHIVDANKMDRSGDANKTMGEGPFTEEVLVRLINRIQSREDSLRAFNAYVLSWLKENGWTSPEDMERRMYGREDILKSLVVARAELSSLSQERDRWVRDYQAMKEERDEMKEKAEMADKLAFLLRTVSSLAAVGDQLEAQVKEILAAYAKAEGGKS